MKKTISIILTMVMLMSMCTYASASGKKCGDSAYWQVDDGTLTISGTGDMWDFENGVIFDSSSDASSIALINSVHTINVNEGITVLGKFAFVRMSNVKNISLPRTLKTIKAGAFFYVKPEKIVYNGSEADWDNITDEGVGTTMPLGSDFLSKIAFKETVSQSNTETKKDYIIEVHNKNEVIASAEISAEGYVKNIKGSEYAHGYFRPLITNINGVTCIDIPAGDVTFNYKDGVLESVSGGGIDVYKKQAVIYGAYSTGKNANCYYIDLNSGTMVNAKELGIATDKNILISSASNDKGTHMWNYDENDRVISYVDYSMGPAANYSYDGDGRLKTYTINNGPFSVKYDYVYITDDDTKEADVQESGIKILLNNKFVKCDQPPVVVNNRTLVPMRAIFEALGAEVSWDGATNTASGEKDGKKVSFKINENAIYINGERKELDVAAIAYNDRTMIPVRAVSEAFDCDVDWSGTFDLVIIVTKNNQPYRIEAIDSNGEVVATARYNDRGLLYEMEGGYMQWFAPLYTNINGNTYYPYISGKKISFSYEKSKINSITVLNNNDTTDVEVIKYDSAGCINEYYGPLKYNKDAETGKVNATNGFLNFTYNEMGLIGRISIQYAPSFEYDENGNMITYKLAYQNGTTKYTYDEDQRLQTGTKGADVVVTYRYVQE